MNGPIYFRIAPDLRRSAYYALAAIVPLVTIAVLVSHFVNEQPLGKTIAVGALSCLLGLVVAVPLRWALRIDERGVARRRILRWDLWQWSDFASGAVEKGYPYTLIDCRRPWWRRRLRLSHMSRDDAQRAMELINAHYRLPSPPEPPSELKFQYGWRRTARLDARGIALTVHREPRAFLWNEVQRVHITRPNPVRRDFATMEIVLPCDEIVLKHEDGTSPSWRGATAEMVNEFVCRYVQTDRIDIDILGQRPAKRIDAEKQLGKARQQGRQIVWCLWSYPIIVVGLAVWVAVRHGVVKDLIIVVVAGAVLIVPIYLFGRRAHRTRCLELERLVASYGGDDRNKRE